MGDVTGNILTWRIVALTSQIISLAVFSHMVFNYPSRFTLHVLYLIFSSVQSSRYNLLWLVGWVPSPVFYFNFSSFLVPAPNYPSPSAPPFSWYLPSVNQVLSVLSWRAGPQAWSRILWSTSFNRNIEYLWEKVRSEHTALLRHACLSYSIINARPVHLRARYGIQGMS